MNARTSLVALTVFTLLIGCKYLKKDSQPDAASQAVEGWTKMKTNLEAANKQIDETLLALNQMTTAGDVKKAYSTFNSEVKQTDSMAAKAKERADNMRKYSAEYVRKWEEEAEKVSDPAMREQMAARKKAIADNFAGVRDAGKAVSAAYQPFSQTLKDLQTSLGMDLTAAGVKGNADAIARANTQGKTLKDRLNEAITAVANVQNTAPAK